MNIRPARVILAIFKKGKVKAAPTFPGFGKMWPIARIAADENLTLRCYQGKPDPQGFVAGEETP